MEQGDVYTLICFQQPKFTKVNLNFYILVYSFQKTTRSKTRVRKVDSFQYPALRLFVEWSDFQLFPNVGTPGCENIAH